MKVSGYFKYFIDGWRFWWFKVKWWAKPFLIIGVIAMSLISLSYGICIWIGNKTIKNES